MERQVSGPVRGVANSTAFIQTPMDLVPIAGMMNVRLHAPESDRPRFGQRPGTVPQFNQQLGNGNPVQAFGIIQRSSGTSAYERVDSSAQAMAFSASTDTRYSRQATRFQRSAIGQYDGDPHVVFVASGNFSLDRAFGKLLDDDKTGGGPPIDQRGNAVVGIDRPLHANEGAGPATMSDILMVSGRKGTAAGDYDEPDAKDHQVIMALQTAWHPRAGVAGDANEHTLVFTALIAPGPLTLHTTLPVGYTDGCLYTSITAVDADTGAILWRNVIKDTGPVLAVDTAIRGSALTCIDDPGGDIFGSNAPVNIIAKSLDVQTDYTFVCAGPYIYVFNTTSGKYLQRASIGSSSSPNGWAKETQRTMVRRGLPRSYEGLTGPFAPANSLLCLFVGSNANDTTAPFNIRDNTTGVGPLPGSDDARFIQAISHWRSGLAEFLISPVPIDTVGATVLTRQQFPGSNDPQPTQTVAETVAGVGHKTLRFSSVLARHPRGGLSYAGCVWPDPLFTYPDPGGSVPFPQPGQTAKTIAADVFYCGFTNRGFGINSVAPAALTNPTYGAAAGWLWPDSSVPPTTVAKFNADGTLAWEVDSESLLRLYEPLSGSRAGVVPYYNDIPTSNGVNGPEATIMGMACDAAGDVYIAGKRNNNPSQPTSGFNVMKLSEADGRIIWRANLAGIIYQHCVKVSPVDGSIFVCGMRNDTWNDPDGTVGTIHDGDYATLWKLSPVDGEVLASLDLGLDDTLWSPGTGTGDPTAGYNVWKHYCSAVSLDIDRSGRIAFATNPGV